MFMDLINRLMGDAPQTLPPADADLAIAALLVRVARADDHYNDAERAHIDRVLACREGLTPEAAAARRLEAEQLEVEATDTVRFTRQIKDRIALEDRCAVLAAMWEIAYADNARSADEDSLIRLVAGLLGIPDQRSAQIRRQVRARMAGDQTGA